jgi:hypothetical protein
MFEQPVQCLNNLNSLINLNGGPCDNESDTRQRSDRRGPTPMGKSQMDESRRRHGGGNLDRARAANHVATNRRGSATIRSHFRTLRNPHAPVFHQVRLPAHDTNGDTSSSAPDKCHQCSRPVGGSGFRRTPSTPIGSACGTSIHHRFGSEAFCCCNDRSERGGLRTTRTHCATDRVTPRHSAHITNQCGGLLNTTAQPSFHSLTHMKKENK